MQKIAGAIHSTSSSRSSSVRKSELLLLIAIERSDLEGAMVGINLSQLHVLSRDKGKGIWVAVRGLGPWLRWEHLFPHGPAGAPCALHEAFSWLGWSEASLQRGDTRLEMIWVWSDTNPLLSQCVRQLRGGLLPRRMVSEGYRDSSSLEIWRRHSQPFPPGTPGMPSKGCYQTRLKWQRPRHSTYQWLPFTWVPS